MRSFVVALTFVASALAYAVTEPSGSQGWTTAGPNVLSWSTVSTDATNFTAVLTNEDRSIMPQNNQILDALVQGSSKSINVNPPSGGFPVGKGFRVNLVKDTDDLSTIYAQSDEFSIVQSSSTLSSTTTAQLSSASGVAASTTGTVLTVDSASDSASATTTDLDPTATNGATTLGMQAAFAGVLAFLGAFLF